MRPFRAAACGKLTRRSFLAGALAAAGAGWLASAGVSGAANAGETRRPVILVHGFGANVSFWRQPGNAIVTRLLQAGLTLDGGDLVPFVYPSTSAAPESEDTEGDLLRAAEQLADQLQATAERSPDRRVNVVGFSMGGLVVRAAFAVLRERGTRVGQLVAAAALIATPNDGLDMLPRLALLGEEVQRVLRALAIDPGRIDLRSVAAQQMMPNSAFLRWLNGVNVDRAVRCTLIAGSLRVTVPWQGRTISLDIGDGLISTASATHLPGASASRYIVIERLALDGAAAIERVASSTVLHPNLPASDVVGLAAVAAVAPWADAVRAELERARQAGAVVYEPAP